MTHPAGDPLVGRTIAHYEILSRLGGGGMGVVYKARDAKLGRPVALKFLPQQWSHDATARERFVREAQAASATHHPNICTIHDVATADDGQLFIVMAYYEGPTLKRRLESGPLPVDEALDIATQVADGLARAHAQGVVHRDVKPGNLILTEDGVRIVDFGLATLVDALQITAEGSTLGTAAYMSPEQVRGESVDARTDVWALGTVLYEMLAGHVPFRGAYAEAIAHAIRNDPPPPLRALRPEAPEEVEQLVFRALHKDPAIRFASGRELARALRQVRGLTVPMDLRTQVVPPPQPHVLAGQDVPRWRPRAAWVGASVVALSVLGGGWLLWPPSRVPVVIAPVSNQTPFDTLNKFQLALTHVAILELGDSRDVRALPYERLLPLVRQFAGAGPVLPAAKVLPAIGSNTTAAVVVVPILEHEDGLWRARAEFRDPIAGPLPGDGIATEPLRSAIPEEAAAELLAQLTAEIERRFESRRSRLFKQLSAWLGRRSSRAPVVGSLDAAFALEEGVNSYEAGEYHRARAAFLRAATLDSQNPLPLAWASRAATLMRQEDEAAAAAAGALKVLSDRTRTPIRLFVRAVSAEAQRDFEAAADWYSDLAGEYADEPMWQMEQAAFEARRGRNRESLAAFHAVTRLDPQLIRAQVELCRVNNTLGEATAARSHAEQALSDYRRLADPAGQVQALFCLTDALVVVDALSQAAQYAADALALTQRHDLGYSLGRAHNYVARVAGEQGRMADAAASWNEALAVAQAVGNRQIEPLLMMNLGVAHEALGHPARAESFFRDSRDLFRKARDDGRAAEIQANIGMLSIEYGINPDEGLQTLETALRVIRERGNRTFEVFGSRIRGEYYRYAGRLARAVEELTRAVNLAFELDREVAVTQTALAQARFDRGQYGAARDLLVEALGIAESRDRILALIRLAQTDIRLGDLKTAAAGLDEARRRLQPLREDGLFPLLYLAEAELAEAERADADALRLFAQAAAFWTDDRPDEPSVAARGALGLLEGVRGQTRAGLAQLQSCIDQAVTMHRFIAATRCRVNYSRVALAGGDADAAWRVLSEIADDSPEREVGLELRAAVHFWRGEVLARRGNRDAAALEHAEARKSLHAVRDGLPERYRDQFAGRVDLRPILSAAVDTPAAASP